MYRDIGHRNHRAVVNQGRQVVEKMRKCDNQAVSEMSYTYESLLKRLDTLAQAAHELVNRDN